MVSGHTLKLSLPQQTTKLTCVVLRWVLEKYDGVRGFFNPETRSFYSRTGNQLRLPSHIIDTIAPRMFLDGELW